MKVQVRLRVAGVDEAGRGPLAGPVVAAAVILNPSRPIRGLADSKVLEPEERERLSLLIRERALCYSVAWADAEEIDSINILQATLLAMRRALLGLRFRRTRCSSTAIVVLVRTDWDSSACSSPL